jgi:MoaA/NifB/PqqE/SkfB family radical SAM enzyme
MSVKLQLETTSTCNARCHFCVYPEAERWGGLMTMGLYRKIIDDAAEIPGITDLQLTGLGEPMLDPHVEDRVWYARRKMPRAPIGLFTNGVHLTPERFDALKEAGLTTAVFSLNAANAVQHEEIMGLKGKFDQVCENIDYAIENRDNVHVEVRAVSNGLEFGYGDMLAFYFRWGQRDKGGYGQCILEGNWTGDKRTLRSFKPNETCGRALGQIYVLFDGKVTTCCFDPTGKQVFGDLSRQTIREVYNAEKYLKFREDHDGNRADRYDICKDCTRI